MNLRVQRVARCIARFDVSEDEALRLAEGFLPLADALYRGVWKGRDPSLRVYCPMCREGRATLIVPMADNGLVGSLRCDTCDDHSMAAVQDALAEAPRRRRGAKEVAS